MGSASLQRILLWQATTALFRMTHCIIIPEQNNRLKLADCAVNYDTTQTEQLSHSVYACMRASVLSCAALHYTALHLDDGLDSAFSRIRIAEYHTLRYLIAEILYIMQNEVRLRS